MNNNIVHIKNEDLRWPFDSNNGGKPYFNTNLPEVSFQETLYVDPFPCYNHNLELVSSLYEEVTNIWKFDNQPRVYVSSFEGLCRTNGQASYRDTWEEPKKRFPYIVLWGKRIPPHPAMTRYLVSHEIGHNVEYSIHFKMGDKGEIENDFRKEYAKLRGIEINTNYSGLTWHKNIGEIIVNDIRILLFNKELEFWPHDCEHPAGNIKLLDFWKEMKQKYGS